MLGLHPDDRVFVSLDEENNRVLLFPASEKGLCVIEIGLSDSPGSLAKAASVLANAGVDLVSSESRSTSRGNLAIWRAVCNAPSVKDFSGLKAALLRAGAKTAKLTRL
jgi:hypothetical protein